MDGYKDFQGKTLDDAIREATAYFDVAREKLEIDIVQDAKSGVFGLIGARKAKVRARRVQLKNTVDELVGRSRDLRASFRDTEESSSASYGADFDTATGGAPRDVHREDSRRDEGQEEYRQEDSRERSSRRGRNDKDNRAERGDAGQFDDGARSGEQDREERRSNNGRRPRNDRNQSERSERGTSERGNGERSERNQDRSRRNRSERNPDRPNQDRQERPNQDRNQSRQNIADAEGTYEPMDDENGVLTEAEARERSSRRRRRGRSRSRSRTDANGMDSNLDSNDSAYTADDQKIVDYTDGDMPSEKLADFDAPRHPDSRSEARRESESRRDADERNGQDSRRHRRDDGRRSGDRRNGDSRRSADSRRDPEGRRSSERSARTDRSERADRGDNRRSSYERNDRPYRTDDRQAPAPREFDDNVEYAQDDAQFMDDQVYERPEGLPDIPLESLDQDLVRSVALEVTERLVTPIIGPAALTVEATDGRVKVGIDCGENSGLLIGREGQTLASIQYLASRIIARKLGAAVRVQLDTGDYRERQDEKLRELALSFADRVRATGRPQSTRPLSSYHRRVVHLVLQDDEEIVTRSKGEGPLKRVIILRRRKNSAE